MLRAVFSRLFRTSRSQAVAQPSTAAPLRVEAMEDRSVPSTVKVSPAALDGWATQTSGTASTAFVAGPETPPLGTGSAQLSVGADGNSGAQVRYTGAAGTKVADLTALSYSTYVEQDGAGGQAPYVILNIDNDNNGTVDDQLFFEPVYQTGAYPGDPVPNQGPLVVGEWQTWNALDGGWWAVSAGTFGPPLVTLDSYVADHPDATIVNSANGLGGVRLVAGFGAGAWDGFVGNVDNLTVATSLDSNTFVFEPARVYQLGNTTLAVDETTGDFTLTYTTGSTTHTVTGTGARVQNGQLKIHAQGTDETGKQVKVDVTGALGGPVSVSVRGKDKLDFTGLELQD